MVSNENERGDVIEMLENEDFNYHDVVIDRLEDDKILWVLDFDEIYKYRADDFEYLDGESWLSTGDLDDDTFRAMETTEDYIYISSSEGGLRVLDRDTFEILEYYEDAHEDTTTLLEIDNDNNEMFTASGDESVKKWSIDGVTVTEEWEHTHQSSSANSMVIDDGQVYTCNGNGEVISADREDGSENWLEQPDGTDIFRGIAVDELRVYTANSSSNILYAFDKTDGSEDWAKDDAPTQTEAIAIDDEYIYLGDNTGNFEIRDKTAGDIVWEDSEVNEDSDDIIIVEDGYFYQTEDDDNERIYKRLTGNETAVRSTDIDVDGVEIDFEATIDWINENEELDLDGVECIVEYREDGETTWEEITITTTSSAPFDFQSTIDELEEFTRYELRAVVQEREEMED